MYLDREEVIRFIWGGGIAPQVPRIDYQEGWLSPTERASVSAISLRQNLVTSR